MVKEALAQGVVEQFQRILECEGVCLILGCSDPDLRHPLLNFWPTKDCLSMVYASGLFGEEGLEDMVRHERIQALCDLAIQSGRLRALDSGCLFLECWHIQSIAAMPLEQSAGILGAFLMVDREPERFGRGEERLLYAYLSMYGKRLEGMFWEQWHLLALKHLACPSRDEKEGTMPDQLIKSEFVSMVGHELRSPISIIKGYAGLLQTYGGVVGQRDQELTPDRQRRYLEAILEQTRLMELLVNDLLDLSRLQQGGLALHPSSIDVEALCRQVVQLGQLRADQQAPGKHRLGCKMATQLPPIWADADRLRQVLLNVIENAIKYSPEGGYIELEVSHSGRSASSSQQGRAWVCLIIRDQGIGIPSSHVARLFRPFERVERPEIACIPGSGMGLYIARKLVEAMEGSIDVQAQQDRGTTVTITLPEVDTSRVVRGEEQDRMSSLLVR